MNDLVVNEKILYLNADREFYEPMSRYRPDLRDYHAPMTRILPARWTMSHANFWWHCTHPEASYPDQGWKIHLSATPAHAPAILVTTARILFAAGVPFKFVLDRTTLNMSNGKRWARGAAGKFITAYPRDTEQTGELLEALYQSTVGYWGPYILSDRRFRDSRIVHYRYGGFVQTKRMSVSGQSVHVIQSSDGGYIDDERSAYFRLPPGVADPFERFAPKMEDEGEPGTLKNGRYKIGKVLAISNSGNVYLAEDRHMSRQVVIKEARPYTNVSYRGLDAVQLLKKEHRLLGVVEDARIAPIPYDFFLDWEHAYLVEEYLKEGAVMRTVLTGMSLLLNNYPTLEDSQKFYRRYRRLFLRLAEILKAIHDRRIVFSDLSMANVIVFLDDNGEMIDMKLIDFEGAYEEGVDVPTHLYTPGFTTDDVLERGMSRREDDYFALGSLLLAGLFPMNSLLMLNRTAHEPYLAACEHDFDLPAPIARLIRELMGPAAQRPPPERAIEILSHEYSPRPPQVSSREIEAVDLNATIDRIMGYVDSVAGFDRRERLYPADPNVYETNSIGLAHGALGIAYVAHKIRGTVDPRVMAWIDERELNPRQFPPGLYIGLSGIAWAFLEMGREAQAKRVLAMADDHYLLYRSPDVFHGVAGWGMAQLKFFLATHDSAYLEAARRAGAFLVESRETDPESGGCFWSNPEGIAAGYAHGASGVAMFLLYLHMASRDEVFLAVGKQALDWVIAQGFDDPRGGMTWMVRDRTRSYTPYWRWGSSGIGRVLLRYWHATGETRYADLIDRIHVGSNHKYTIFPGYFFGTAGIVEMYMDMARFPRWAELAPAAARRLLSGCMLFPIEKEGGLAFPGESLSRISCDLGTGNAGIALVMHRYRTRCGASFMLDEFLPGWSKEDRPIGAEHDGVRTIADDRLEPATGPA